METYGPFTSAFRTETMDADAVDYMASNSVHASEAPAVLVELEYPASTLRKDHVEFARTIIRALSKGYLVAVTGYKPVAESEWTEHDLQDLFGSSDTVRTVTGKTSAHLVISEANESATRHYGAKPPS